MSRFKKLWVLLVPTALVLTLGATPASADPPTQPLPPVANDVCGNTKDTFYTPETDPPLDDVSWRDTLGNYYFAGEWHPSGGVASITLIAKVSTDEGWQEYTYPPLTFGTEPDSACVDAPDTITVTDLVCNPQNGGTMATFTYTNTPENGRSHTNPLMLIARWGSVESSFVYFRVGTVADGESVSVTGGDDYFVDDDKFFLPPGTHYLYVSSKEATQRKVGSVVVPACGKLKVPPGDPSGKGPSAKPKGWLKQLARTSTMKMRAINRKVTHTTVFKLAINPKKGKTVTKTFKTAPNKVVKKVYQGKVGTKYVLKAKVKVAGKWKWRVLKRATIR